MQDPFALPRTFLHRTDVLASRIGVNVQDLPDRIGISRRTLFAARKSDDGITRKTWLALEAAEQAAGIEVSAPAKPAVPADPTERMDQMDERLTKIEAMLADLVKAVGRIAPPADGSQTSSEAPGKKLAS